MPVTVYGDGSKYGDADAFYGRISAGLAAAQAASVRETGLEVRVIDEGLNAYEIVNDEGNILAENFKQLAIANGHNDARSPFYWGYRGFSDAVKLDNGHIIRVRVGGDVFGGSATYADRQLYIQEITDPSNAAQWQSWSVLYSGIHFCAVIIPTGASTYDIYHSKWGAGFCANNGTIWATANDGADLSKVIRIAKMTSAAQPRQMMLTVVGNYAHDNHRVLDLYFTSEAISIQPNPSVHNFKWERNTVAFCEDPYDSDYAYLFRSFQMHASPRLSERGESITATRVGVANTQQLDSPPILIRGFTGLAGRHIVNLAGVHTASDGFIYLFYYELHTNDEFASIQSGPFFFWQRSKDGVHWTEPVLVGYDLPKFAGAFEYDHSGTTYLYLVANGAVVRRPMESVEYVLDNYVPVLQLEIPRGNQEATGSVLVANPEGVHDSLRELSDRRIHIRPGLKTADGSYEFKQIYDFWIRRVTEEAKHDTSRLTVQVGDIWARLGEQMRDTFNIVGQTVYEDWGAGRPNESFAYFFEDGEPLQADGAAFLQLSAGTTVLWTGWKGHNPDFSFEYTAPSGLRAYARYVDADNYMKFAFFGDMLTIVNRIEGIEEEIFDDNIGTPHDVRIQLKWGFTRVWADGDLVVDLNVDENPDPVVEPGYVGWFSSGIFYIDNFRFSDWERNITSHDLIKYALAMGDYHDVVVGGPESRQLAMIWGPQTDIPTAADGLRQVLEAEKLDLIWLDGLIQVGRFSSTDSTRTLENEVISSAYREEASRRINMAVVDGNEHSWFEADEEDGRERGRQIIGYFDIPELMDQEAVTSRAIEEIKRSTAGQAPGGEIPLIFDLFRMDVITWVDNRGNSQKVRVEGMRIDINQSITPYQREELDTSLVLE